jgi:hypothetical protein
MPMLLNLKCQFWSTAWGLIFTDSVHNSLCEYWCCGTCGMAIHSRYAHNFLELPTMELPHILQEWVKHMSMSHSIHFIAKQN